MGQLKLDQLKSSISTRNVRIKIKSCDSGGEAAVILVWMVIGLASWLVFNLAVFLLLHSAPRKPSSKSAPLAQGRTFGSAGSY